MTPALYAVLGVGLGALIGPLVVFTIAFITGDVAEGTVLSLDEWREKERR